MRLAVDLGSSDLVSGGLSSIVWSKPDTDDLNFRWLAFAVDRRVDVYDLGL